MNLFFSKIQCKQCPDVGDSNTFSKYHMHMRKPGSTPKEVISPAIVELLQKSLKRLYVFLHEALLKNLL